MFVYTDKYSFDFHVCNKATFCGQVSQVEQEMVDEEEGEVIPKALKIEVDTPKDTLLSSLLNLHCVPCNKTFRKQKVYEMHMREMHGKVELNEFSEPEDLMDGINVMVGNDMAGEEGEMEEMEDSKEWYVNHL